jgi:uncharacterized protein YaiE (UPF0345 family)
MIKVNEYLGGQVKSLGAESPEGRFTVGIMLAGEYNFKTEQEERITVTIGVMMVQVPPRGWQEIHPGETITVPPGVSFHLEIKNVVSYVCFYK